MDGKINEDRLKTITSTIATLDGGPLLIMGYLSYVEKRNTDDFKFFMKCISESRYSKEVLPVAVKLYSIEYLKSVGLLDKIEEYNEFNFPGVIKDFDEFTGGFSSNYLENSMSSSEKKSR